MATQIIDALLVTLGLDASKFTEGQKKATQQMSEMRSSMTDAANSIGSSLMGVAGKLTAFFIGFEGIRGAIDLVKRMAYELKQVAIAGELMGTSFPEARTLQEFSELAGGGHGSNDFFQWMSGFRQQMAGLVFGRMPPWMLPSMIGINPMQLAGMDPLAALQLIQKQTIAHGALLQRMMPFATTPTVAEELFLQAMGYTGAQAAEATHPAHFNTDLKKAIDRNRGLTDQTGENARKAANAMIDLRYQVENASTRAFPLLTSTTGLLETAFMDLAKLVEEIVNSPLAKWIEGMTGGFFAGETGQPGSGVMHWLGGLDRYARDTQFGWMKKLWGSMFGPEPSINDLHHIPLMPHMGVVHHAAAPPNTTSSLLGPAGQSSTQNSFAVGSINVNTSASNLDGLMRDVRSATARKFNVTQADSGVVA